MVFKYTGKLRNLGRFHVGGAKDNNPTPSILTCSREDDLENAMKGELLSYWNCRRMGNRLWQVGKLKDQKTPDDAETTDASFEREGV